MGKTTQGLAGAHTMKSLRHGAGKLFHLGIYSPYPPL